MIQDLSGQGQLQLLICFSIYLLLKKNLNDGGWKNKSLCERPPLLFPSAENNRHLIHNEMCLSGGVLEVISWHWGR